MTQIMIHQCDGQHRLHDGHSTNAYAGIMTASGDNLDFLTLQVDTGRGMRMLEVGLMATEARRS